MIQEDPQTSTTNLQQRGLFLIQGEINPEVSEQFIRWLIWEGLQDQPRELTVIINSPGGDLYEAWAMIDVMRMSPNKIKTLAVGSCMSAALLVFSQGQIRLSGDNTSFMSHQHTDSLESSKFHDTQSYHRESVRNNLKMQAQLKSATNLTERQLRRTLLSASDYYFDRREALEIGLVTG